MDFNFKEHRLLDDFLTSTRISELFVHKMLMELNISTFVTERGITLTKADYDRLINSVNFKRYYNETLKFANNRYQKDQKVEAKEKFEKRIHSEITWIKKFVCELEGYHRIIVKKYDLINDESADCAACLLFIKAINMFNTVIYCVESKLLCSNVYFRPINEAINLAQYFLLTKESPEGKESLFNWFRDNKTPRTDIIVSTLKEYSETHTNEIVAHIFSSMSYQLVQTTSKIIHNSYSDTLKHLAFKSDGSKVILDDIEFNGTNNSRELFDYIIYLISLLWSIHMSYQICFELLIKDIDKDILTKIDK